MNKDELFLDRVCPQLLLSRLPETPAKAISKRTCQSLSIPATWIPPTEQKEAEHEPSGTLRGEEGDTENDILVEEINRLVN